MRLLCKYFFLTFLLILFSAAFLVLDGYMKNRYDQTHPNEARLSREALEAQAKANWLVFGHVPDFDSKEFHFWTGVSWSHLTFLAMMELILISKCVY